MGLCHPSRFGLSTCVDPPYMLLTRSPSTQESGDTSITCINYIHSNCVIRASAHQTLLLLWQPSFVMIPVHLQGTWQCHFEQLFSLKLYEALTRKQKLFRSYFNYHFCRTIPTSSIVVLSQPEQTAHRINQFSSK